MVCFHYIYSSFTVVLVYIVTELGDFNEITTLPGDFNVARLRSINTRLTRYGYYI